MHQAAPFDDLAADYDGAFTASSIGQRMRAAVWQRLAGAFRPGERVLELNCGTGEDAVYLGSRGVRVLATDASPRMLAIASAKIERAKLSGVVEIAQLSIEDLSKNRPAGSFNGVLSNFGGLNCIADLPAIARALAQMMRPGGRVLLCTMGPVVPWEWGWYFAHGQPRKALRRLHDQGTSWRGLTVRYPSIGQVQSAFAPHFSKRRVSAIGALVPPTYVEPWAGRHPWLLGKLDRIERRFETVWPLPWLADHFLIELERVSDRTHG